MMKAYIAGAALALLIPAGAAMTQTAPPQDKANELKDQSAREKEGKTTEHPPTNRMNQAVPPMKAEKDKTKNSEHPPTNRMDEAVPPMKPTDKQ